MFSSSLPNIVKITLPRNIDCMTRVFCGKSDCAIIVVESSTTPATAIDIKAAMQIATCIGNLLFPGPGSLLGHDRCFCAVLLIWHRQN